ncbi:CRISPR-associated endoribonuclease Cas6 [Picrophilus oshimae]|uniref:DUF 57 protein n=1 Tax=Picrophilus torridus (strain ATCC 700027 / DSM 9790 / JCM 10055 / NBRC 100828 / KAW 2/3) TaxID=1122961 RepID=Q6L114_PICTO|nr:CRISPR-associated endoribonuclease Cas6 [Picrophilus oshimae]AAT43338.1 DUF 57 protein [Picrophilus oshimae DSM 9789]
MKLVIELTQNQKTISYSDIYSIFENIIFEIGRSKPLIKSAMIDDFPYYCGSHPLPYKGRISNNTISYGKYRIYISSGYYKIIDDIMDAIKSGNVKHRLMRINSVKMENNNCFFDTVNMISRSPVIIKYNGEYIDANNRNFVDAIKNDIIKKYSFTGLNGYIDFIKIIHFKTLNLRINNEDIKASMIKFTIMSDNKIINNILNTGIGELTKSGFGFIDEERIPLDFGIMY